jgi:glycosyltransferase involved in cell wall biosynthesis
MPNTYTTARRTCLMILGMHRSGTSAVTRITGLLGAALPRTVLDPAPDNPTGFWESPGLIALNDRIIARLDNNWDDWRKLRLDRLTEADLAGFEDALHATVESEFACAPMFAIKDPRVCRLASLYSDALARRGITPRFLLMVRNPLAVMESLASRDGMTQSYVAILWLRHFLDAESQTRGKPRAFVHYESLLGDWRRDIERTALQIGISWPRSPSDAAPEIARFLKAELQHHVFSTDDLNARDDLPTWVKDAYAASFDLQESPMDAAAMARLDVLRTTFDTYSDLLGEAAFPEFRQRQSRIHAALAADAATIESLSSELARSQADKGGLVAKLEAADKETAALRSEASDLSDRIAARDEELRARQQDLQARNEELRARDEELRARGEELRARDEELTDRDAELRTRDAELGVLNQRLAVLEHERRDLHLAKPTPAARRSDRQGVKRRLLRLRGNPLARRVRWRDVVCLERSGLFEATWYRNTYNDVMSEGVDPLLHYLAYGAREGRQPHPLFHTQWYLAEYDDVRRSGTNPLVHYIEHGASEGRDPSPTFSTTWYRRRYPDIAAIGVNPLWHYWYFGAAEGRHPCPHGECPRAHVDAPILTIPHDAQKDSVRSVEDVVCRIEKTPPQIATRQNVLFVTHLPQGAIKPHTTDYLRALKSAGLSLILIAVVPNVTTGIVGLDVDVDGLVIRSNHGYDFSAWAHVLKLWPELWASDLLIFANDSVFGPLRPQLLHDMIDRIRAMPADFAGLTDSCERDKWHIQSYFFALKRQALANGACQQFWASIRSHPAKQDVIDYYELGWAQTLKDSGLQGQVFFPSSDHILENRQNPTLAAWRHLLDAGYPFIKVQLLRDNIPGVDCRGWESVVRSAGYDVSRIHAHLRSVRDRRRPPRMAPTAWRRHTRHTEQASAGRRREDANAPVRVSFIGPWNYASGLGVASRGYLSALWHTKLAIALHPVHLPFHTHARIAPTLNVSDFSEPADVCIVHLNPDAWPALFRGEMRRAFDAARVKVGLWVWEMEQAPNSWSDAFAAVDCVWAPSTYCRDVFSAFSRTPVHVLPHVVCPPSPLRRLPTRSRLGIPPDRRLILYTFDGASYLIRKNPSALVRAFERSGLHRDGWCVVLNTKNLLDRPSDGQDLAQLAAQTPDVYLINRPLSANEHCSLLAESEIYASPHCSEGFGLTIAEAMAAGKLVVATDYGGSTDFLDAGCGFPVAYTKVTLQDDFGHYTKGGVWASVNEDDLARALQSAARAAGDPQCELGKLAARRIAERLSPSAVGKLLEALCSDLAR